jgi:FkbM family methyltransferase
MYRFYLRRWLYKKELQRLTVSVNGLSLALPSRCAGIKEELILYGIHEPLASSCYSNLLKPKDIIFDIGTNIGYYMSVADKALNGECSIYGFEADPELAELARTNGKKLRAQCNVEHLAVAEHTGTTIFFVSEVSNWGTLRARDDLRLSNKVEVRCTSLDNYAKTSNTNPDVIRMDIEGGEILALRGGRRVLSRTRLLFMELHCAFLADSEIEEICDILEDAELQHVIWFNRYYDWP